MHKTQLGYGHQALALLLRELAHQLEFAFEVRGVLDFVAFEGDLSLYVLKGPVFAIGIHAQRDAGAGSQSRREEFGGRKAQVGASVFGGLIAYDLAAPIVEGGGIMILANEGLDLCWHNRKNERR